MKLHLNTIISHMRCVATPSPTRLVSVERYPAYFECQYKGKTTFINDNDRMKHLESDKYCSFSCSSGRVTLYRYALHCNSMSRSRTPLQPQHMEDGFRERLSNREVKQLPIYSE